MYGNYLEEACEGLQGVDLAERYLLTLKRVKWLCDRVIEFQHVYDRKFVEMAKQEKERIKFMELESQYYLRMKKREADVFLK